jgi:hypothetical protein
MPRWLRAVFEFIEERKDVHAYVDWEGFVDPDDVLRVATKAWRKSGMPQWPDKNYEHVWTLFLHWVHTYMDSTGDEPTDDELRTAIEVLLLVVNEEPHAWMADVPPPKKEENG